MPQGTYSRKDLIDAFRAENPDAAHIADNDIFRAIATEDPELAKGISELHQPAYQSPKYGPTGPNATEMVSEQAANVLKGIPQAVTGIPAAAKSVFNILKSGLSGNAGQAVSQTGDLVKGALQPFTTTARGVGALAGVSEAPTDEEFANAAQGAGAMLGAAELPNVVSGLREGAAALSQTAPAQKVASAFQSIKGKFQKVPVTAAEVNKWMTVEPSDVAHGANPGQRLIDEGLIDKTKELTKAKIQPALQGAGQDLQNYLQGASAQGVEIDGTSIVDKALNDAKVKLKAPTETSFTNQLQNIKDKLNDVIPGVTDLDKLSPTEAHQIKVHVGDNINWRSTTYDPLNDALKDIYRGLNEEIKSKVTGVGDIQSRWGDLYVADKRLGEAIGENTVGKGTPAAAPKPQPSPVFKRLKKAAPYAAGALGLEGVRRLYNVARPD